MRAFSTLLFLALLAAIVYGLYWVDARGGVARALRTPPPGLDSLSASVAPAAPEPAPAAAAAETSPAAEQATAEPAEAPPAEDRLAGAEPTPTEAEPAEEKLAAVEPPAEPAPAPPAAPKEPAGAPLKTSTETVLVIVPEEAAGSKGTAFTIARGVWMTARHVVEGCGRVGLVVQDGKGVVASDVSPAENADVAVVRAPLEKEPLPVDLRDSARRLGEKSYMFGFPQGVPGEVAGKLLGKDTMTVRGRYTTREPVLAWAESSRTKGVTGELGGISGGPALDQDGAAVGIVVAEAPRRGRIYTAAPSSLSAALDRAEAGPTPDATAPMLSDQTYFEEGGRLRSDLRVAQVRCMAAR